MVLKSSLVKSSVVSSQSRINLIAGPRPALSAGPYFKKIHCTLLYFFHCTALKLTNTQIKALRDLLSAKLQSVRGNELNVKKERKEVKKAPFNELSNTNTVTKMVRFL